MSTVVPPTQQAFDHYLLKETVTLAMTVLKATTCQVIPYIRIVTIQPI